MEEVLTITKEKVRKEIADTDYVRIKRSGPITEIMTLEKPPGRKQTTRRLTKDYYLDLRTGEICEYEHIENRSDDMRTIRKSLSQGRDIINANVQDVEKCRWVTLTYARCMKNPEVLYKDFYRLRRRMEMAYGKSEYISAAEPQARGAWHMHVIFIFPEKAPYLDPGVISRLWGQGFVKISALDDIDNIGAYLSAYLADAPNGSENGEKTGSKSKYKKGGRLHMYPPGMHIFRWSKGCKRPEIEWLRGKEAKEKYASLGELTYEKGMAVQSGDYSQKIEYRYYNSKRKKSKGRERHEENGNGTGAV